MNTRPLTLKRVLLVAAIAALGTGLFFTTHQPSAKSISRGNARASVRGNSPASMGLAGDAPLAQSEASPVAVAVHSSPVQMRARPADATLTLAYPAIKNAVADWHEFNRQAKSITVAPYSDMPIAFERVQVKDEGRYVTWFGTNKEIPGSSLISVASPSGSLSTVMIIPGTSQFGFYTEANGKTFISETQPGEEGCEVGTGQPDRTAAQAPTTSALFKFQYQSVANSYSAAAPSDFGGAGAPVQGAPAAVTGSTLFVDVLVMYDADCLNPTGFGGKRLWGNSPPANIPAYIDALAKTYIEAGNVVLNNSLITNFQWRYLGAIQSAAYTRPADALNTVVLNAILPGGAIGTWVSDQAYMRGADQVVMWRGDDGGAGGGVAQSIVQTPVGKNNGRAVVRLGTSYKVMIHEMGHNFGCQHDRGNAVGTEGQIPSGVPDSNGFYAYGQLWSTPSPIPAAPPITASTLMGYGAAVIPYFSNPNITVHVDVALSNQGPGVGDWGDQSLGRAITDPKAAYNAKVLTDNASAMAALTEEITVPVITAQPQNTSVTTGNSLSLSVTVTGGGLVYQWSRDGTPVAGQTSSSYSSANASASTAGSYTVTASNSMGSVTSTAATVTVMAAPVVTPPSSSGGGGGGGALSFWFLGALSLLTFARRKFRGKSSLNYAS